MATAIDRLLLALSSQPSAPDVSDIGGGAGLGAAALGMGPLLAAGQGAMSAGLPATEQAPTVTPIASTPFGQGPGLGGVALPQPGVTPEQVAQARRTVAEGGTQQGMDGQRALATATLAGQIPQLGGQIGRLFDTLSDRTAKRSVEAADSDLDSFLRALGG